MNIQTIDLDLDKQTDIIPTVRIAQGDKRGTTIKANVYDSGPANLSGLTAQFEMRLPYSGEYYSTPATISGSTVQAVIDESYAGSVPGLTDNAYFVFKQGDTVICSTSRFNIDVLPSAKLGATPGGRWASEVDAAIEAANTAASNANTKATAANTAANSANSAATAANSAASAANTAASNANDKASAANIAAANANSNASAANTAATNATNAATAANSAASAANAAADATNAAIEAVGDISELEVPLMSPDVRGGAKLDEQGGLALRDGALGIGDLVQESDGEVRGPIAGLTAEGWAEQDSTTGKNLLPNTLSELQSINRSGTWSGNAYTMNGLTFTREGDGSILVEGTASTTTTLRFVHEGVSLNGGSAYTLSGCPSGGSSSTYEIMLTDSIQGAALAHDYGSDATYTPSETRAGYFQIAIRSGYAIPAAGLTFYPQLELGSTATEYEPYTGGAPSPSPDYPQEIRVARGRNLAEVSAISTSSVDLCTISPGTYTLSCVQSGTRIYSTSILSIRLDGTAITSISASATPSSDRKSVAFEVAGDGVLSVFPSNMNVGADGYTFTDIQLELGSTTTPYVPYGHVGLEVKGKNRFRFDKLSNEYNTTRTNDIPNGSMTIVTTSTYAGSYITPENLGLEDGKTYTARAYVSGVSANEAYLCVVSGTRLITYSDRLSSSGWVLLTFVHASTYTKFRFAVANGTATFSSIQIEEGSTATKYGPYFYSTTPIPLPSRGWVGSLPDGTADKLTLDGAGKVEWEENTNEIVLDGDETWSVGADGKRISSSLGSASCRGVATNVVFPGYSTHFLAKTGNNTYAGVLGISTDVNGQGIFISDGTGSMTVETWTQWLSTNPVTVLYPLATPVTEEAGYVDLPDIPSDATVSIPELDALNVEYFIDNSVTKLISQWKERLDNQDLADIEDAVGDLTSVVANLVTHDQFYFGYDEVNGKQMISIFKRGDI